MDTARLNRLAGTWEHLLHGNHTLHWRGSTFILVLFKWPLLCRTRKLERPENNNHHPPIKPCMIARYEALKMLVECPGRLHHEPEGGEGCGFIIRTNKCVGIPCTDNCVAFTVAIRSQCWQLRLGVGGTTASKKRMKHDNQNTSNCEEKGRRTFNTPSSTDWVKRASNLIPTSL